MRKPSEAWGANHGQHAFGYEAGPAKFGEPPGPVAGEKKKKAKQKAQAALDRLQKTNDDWRGELARKRKPGIGA